MHSQQLIHNTLDQHSWNIRIEMPLEWEEEVSLLNLAEKTSVRSIFLEKTLIQAKLRMKENPEDYKRD